MNDNFTLRLNSPITEEEWDMIIDVDFDNTEQIWFHTKNGKEVHFYKDAIPINFLIKTQEEYCKRYGEVYKAVVLNLVEDWEKEYE